MNCVEWTVMRGRGACQEMRIYADYETRIYADYETRIYADYETRIYADRHAPRTTAGD